MVPPNLRSVVAQGWRSIGSRRNFSSSPGSNGETDSIYDAVKAGLYKYTDSKGESELIGKLRRRGIGVLTGYCLGFVTIGKPSWEIARDVEKERSLLERRQSE